MAEKQGKVTIYDVAALAGVSVSSVSRVLHQVPNVRADVCERVKKAIEELDYRPNRSAQMLKTRRAYMLVHIVADVTHPFYVTLHRQLRREAEKRGYQMILFDADQDGERVSRFIYQNMDRMDGLICSARGADQKLLDVFSDCRLPVVFTHDCGQKVFDACFPDPCQGTQLCMEHLLSLGHRRIAFVGSGEQDNINRERLAAYRAALTDAGIAPDERLICLSGAQMNGGYRAGMLLSALEDAPTAVCTSGDMIAVGVIQAMHDIRWDVPGKVSVTGENDLEIGRSLSPALTTASDPAAMICPTVIEYLLDRVEGRYTGPARIIEKAERTLIVRGSTGECR